MHRFKLHKALGEAAAIIILGCCPTLVGAVIADGKGESIGPVFGIGMIAIATTVTAMLLLRWQRSFFVTESGLTFCRGTGGAVVVPWAQIREMNEGGAAGLRLVVGTADGGRLSITDDYENAAELMATVRRRGRDAVVANLEREWVDEGRMTFRHPGARSLAHVEYFLAAAGTAAAGAGAWHLLRRSNFLLGTLFTCALMAAIVLAIVTLMRRDASWRGACVTLTPAGMFVSRLDGEAHVAWADVTGAEHVGWELVVRREAGAPVPVPLTIGNAGYFQHYVSQLSARPPSAVRPATPLP